MKKDLQKTDILGRPAKYFWTVIRIYDSCFLPSKKQTKSKKQKWSRKFIFWLKLMYISLVVYIRSHFMNPHGLYLQLGHRNFFCLHHCNKSSLTPWNFWDGWPWLIWIPLWQLIPIEELVVLKNCEPEASYILANLLNILHRNFQRYSLDTEINNQSNFTLSERIKLMAFAKYHAHYHHNT